MPLDSARADLILQYALLLAGQEDDFFDRQLGPIHLLKYCYLADLIHARYEDGRTFTGASWTFYKFGPWAQDVHARIAPALRMVQADEKVMASDYGDRQDWVRWWKTDDHLLEARENALPSCIRRELRPLVHRFGKDTPALLDFVYRTAPMLEAAPGQTLDFALEARARPVRKADVADTASTLSANRQKKLRERLKTLREQSSARSAGRQKIVKLDQPRYDEVFDQGVAWLEGLAGPVLPEGNLMAEFSDDVWTSSTRKGSDLS
ncbi:hypothetical protein [Sinimarinibacterium thermocellulolyticum]|jgi:hypothetical protein|uniref:Antitoxin SocA-like Panacea domain-containing protein n=1 Tax=Sinimarinibacterium thermocellulolyticum TaxID=3170016 RepID=A0ABV2A959_9GAMM